MYYSLKYSLWKGISHSDLITVKVNLVKLFGLQVIKPKLLFSAVNTLLSADNFVKFEKALHKYHYLFVIISYKCEPKSMPR